jgi:hypothetical protein
VSPARSKASGETTTCPWCSATVPVEAVTCPSCGAQLREAAEVEVVGVTQIDPSVTSRSRRARPRGRLTSWLTGDNPAEAETGGKVEAPSEAVRREMLKLELAAIDAELEAKATAAAANSALPPEKVLAEPPPPADGTAPEAG